MGKGTFNSTEYRTFSTSTVGLSTSQIYTSRSIHPDLNPFGVKVRESRDSVDNPLSTPLIVAVDVTGSMGMLADVIARKGLGTLFESVIDRKPITDPHVMFMALGDANHDRAPLQVSQFEADNRIVEQLTKIYLEGGGGGNSFESYNLPWYFAAYHTAHDSLEKRGKRGYLFTLGDEEAPNDLTKEQIRRFIGDDIEERISTESLLKKTQRAYDVFHIIIEEGSHAKHNLDRVVGSWTPLLGQHIIKLSDHTKLAETIVSAIQVAEGADPDKVAASWGPSSRVIAKAVFQIPKSRNAGLLT